MCVRKSGHRFSGKKHDQQNAVAVPPLRIERALGHRIGGAEAADHRIVDAAIHVHEADRIELLVPRKAAARLALKASRGIVPTIRETPLAPCIVGEPLDYRPDLVRNDRDRAQMILAEIARQRRRRRRRVLDHHADKLAARDQIVVP